MTEEPTDPIAALQARTSPHTVQAKARLFSAVGEKESPGRNKVASVGERIWKNTEWLFEELWRGMEGRSAEEVMKSVGTGRPQGDKKWASGEFAVLLHALDAISPSQLSTASPPVLPVRRRTKSSLKANTSKRISRYYNYSRSNKRKSLKASGEPKAKTGRKPKLYECFACFEAFAYKVELIEHFQAWHKVNKSRSLLYKRINEGEEAMRKLYHL